MIYGGKASQIIDLLDRAKYALQFHDDWEVTRRLLTQALTMIDRPESPSTPEEQ